jgi:hypothetical protein
MLLPTGKNLTKSVEKLPRVKPGRHHVVIVKYNDKVSAIEEMEKSS